MWIHKEQRKGKANLEFWQEKINLNFENEFYRYKRLNDDLGMFEYKKTNGYCYNTYEEQKQEIENKFKNLTMGESGEFRKYLERQVVACDLGKELMNVIPLSLMVVIMADLFLNLNPESGILTYIIGIVVFLVMFLRVLKFACYKAYNIKK